MALADKISNARVLLGISARKLARNIGVSHSYISQIENGQIQKPSLSVLKRLAAVLPGVTYPELLRQTGYQPLAEPWPPQPPPRDGASTPVPSNRERTRMREVIFRKLYEAAQSIVTAPGALLVESESGERLRAVPLFTTIPASFGQPSGATISLHDDFEVIRIHEDRLNHDPACFALRVKGDSMVEAGILPGDIVVVSPNTPYESGDICVVRVNGGEHSLKRVLVHGDFIILQPANSNYEPEIIDNSRENDLYIYGKVIHMERSLI